MESKQLKNNKKEIFSKLRECIFEKDNSYKHINEVKISLLKSSNIVDEIKTLKVIELDDLESFLSYINYDYFSTCYHYKCYRSNFQKRITTGA